MINRGKLYWGENYKAFPFCEYYYGDRHSYFEFQKLIAYISKKYSINQENKWDIVLDFCCFERKEAKSIIRGLDTTCRLYVFISSDSVYDVCDESLRKEVLIKEEYAIRPENQTLLKKLNDEDDYGNDKLRCEEYFLSHVNDQFFYCCLRFPDVIGPYDSSGRFWCYLEWLRVSEQHPIHFNKFTHLRKLSFVYSKDVSQLLLNLLKRSRSKDMEFLKEIHQQSFNVSFDENYTLLELLESISSKISVDVIVYKSV
jgi:nucleoside-diphosphate-sugar epimerase